MTTSENPELVPSLEALAQLERQTRAQLVDARDQLRDRDERFAVLEAEMWAGFEARERRHRELIEGHGQEGARLRGEIATRDQEASALRAEIDRLQHETQLLNGTIAVLTEETFRLQVRLQRILSSPPGRLYARFLELPGFSLLRVWRSRRYESALARRRPS
jgi:hypothetical protein